jgi:ribose transport system substrate-binding protein
MSNGTGRRLRWLRFVGAGMSVAALLVMSSPTVSQAKSLQASAKSAMASRKWVIGVSNTVVGNGWREEMICSVKAQALASGQVKKVVVSDISGTAADQISAIRTLISDGVNAIILDPADRTALDSVIQQATSRGITVVSVDQAVDAPSAYIVENNQVKYGYLGALWLFKTLGGHGNVVEMRGAAGAPADLDRQKGFDEALAHYPGIKVVRQEFTGWQFATAGQDMLSILNSGVKVNGVWTSGVDYTVVNAFKAAGKPLVPIVGAEDNEFIHQMLTMKGLKAAAVTNPATIGGVGVTIAVRLLDGKKEPRLIQLTPQVWTATANRAILEHYYSPSLAPTYSDEQEVPPYTTYTLGQLHSCKGP